MATDIAELGVEIPLLRDGDQLTRAEFERRWDAMPKVTKAELIDGVVSMPPAVSNDHGAPHFQLQTWFGLYQIFTPGVGGADNTSIRFDDNNMPQPDVLLRILETHGGQCRVRAGYLEGPPELIVEIACTTTEYDLGAKRDVYRRSGVQEYVVWRVAERALDWFTLQGEYYFPLDPGPDGVIRSKVFPGLWIDPVAVVAGDSTRLWTVAQLGHASPEHSAFIAELQQRLSGR